MACDCDNCTNPECGCVGSSCVKEDWHCYCHKATAIKKIVQAGAAMRDQLV